MRLESFGGGGWRGAFDARAGASEFVGREEALAALNGALAAAARGSGTLVVVHGEFGIGKTHTVRQFARAATRSGAVVLWGTCHGGAAMQPYGPWGEALKPYVAMEGARLRTPLERDGPILAGLLPGLRPDLAAYDAASAVPSSAARLRLREAVAELLDAVPHVPVLVMEDVQRADADTLDLLSYVARHAPKLLIVVTCRGGELHLTEAAARLADIGRCRQCEYVLLESLPHDESAQLLRLVAGRRLDPHVVDQAHRESGGNPYFVCELGRHLSCHDTLAEDGAHPLPQTIRHAVALRLTDLSTEARSVLGHASVFTAEFGFNELLELTRLDEDRLLDSLDEALAAELIRPGGAERYDYVHPLVRRVLYYQLSPSRRARLHRRLASVLEETLGARDDRAAELARQYRASAMLPGAERGVPHALDAARGARAAHAHGEAIALLEIAWDLAPADDLATRARIASELTEIRTDALPYFRRADEALPDGLTAREAEVLSLIAGGRTNKEIATALVVSVHTVERHVQNAYRKIRVRNRADASAYAVRAGLATASL